MDHKRKVSDNVKNNSDSSKSTDLSKATDINKPKKEIENKLILKEDDFRLHTKKKRNKMVLIDDKKKRSTTFCKRKSGVLKKAYELSTLTGSEILLVVCSTKGKYAYTYTTKRFEPVIRMLCDNDIIVDAIRND